MNVLYFRLLRDVLGLFGLLPYLAELFFGHFEQLPRPVFQVLGGILGRVFQYLLQQRVERPTYAWPRLFSEFHDLAPVDFDHANRYWVSHSLLYHRLVLAQAERLLFRAPGAYTVAYAQVYKVPDVLFADIGHYPAHRRQGYLLRFAKKHVPTHQRGGFIDCFT